MSNAETKKICVVNRSAIPITVSWIIFLTHPPLKDDERGEESFNVCVDSAANLDSNHSEESSKSIKVYLPKNASDAGGTFRNLMEITGEVFPPPLLAKNINGRYLVYKN